MPIMECLALMMQLKSCTPDAESSAPPASATSAASLNSFRTSNGLAALRTTPKMEQLARDHAQDMAQRDAMDHAGFMEKRGPAGARAENVAYGCKDEACTIKMWINSSGHRANMLLGEVKTYGLASAVSKSGKKYWALELGTDGEPRRADAKSKTSGSRAADAPSQRPPSFAR